MRTLCTQRGVATRFPSIVSALFSIQRRGEGYVFASQESAGCGATPVPEPGQSCKQRGGEPDPKEFARENFEAAFGEEAADANGGNADGAPGEKVAVVVEWGEEGDPEAAVGHGVKNAVAGRS